MLRALMEKVYNMQEQMCNVNKETEMLRKNQKEILWVKNTAREVKISSGGLISRLDTAKERINELEDMSVKPPRLKYKEEKTRKTNTEPWENYRRCNTPIMELPKERKEQKKYWSNNSLEFPPN